VNVVDVAAMVHHLIKIMHTPIGIKDIFYYLQNEILFMFISTLNPQKFLGKMKFLFMVILA
jgi:hypothetical protein